MNDETRCQPGNVQLAASDKDGNKRMKMGGERREKGMEKGKEREEDFYHLPQPLDCPVWTARLIPNPAMSALTRLLFACKIFVREKLSRYMCERGSIGFR